MTLHENRGATWIKFSANQDTLNSGYYIKDNMVIKSVGIGTDNDENRTMQYIGNELDYIDYIDYIGSFHIGTGQMLLSKNPFKK